MFVDTATVLVAAGNGGRGALSFRREKYIDKGGPDGGNGGKGGDVIFVGDNNTDTLVTFRYHPELKAQPGQAGADREKHGKNGADLLVKVPLGTVVYRGEEIVADITRDGQKVVIAKGGEGGFGNAHFKTSTRQTPRIVEVGERGEAFEARLELKLLADVGLIGFPNAGKSTFLSVVSNARPEIADYPFTTLSPNLGMAQVDDTALLVADIPGLIEGAAQGKGLGDAFLRHVERTPVLLHLIDVYNNDIANAYHIIRAELANYSQELVGRPEIVAVTKTEGLDVELIDDQVRTLQAVVPKKTPVFAISAQAHQGLLPVLRALVKEVKKASPPLSTKEETTSEVPTITLQENSKQAAWTVGRDDEVFVVKGNKIEKFANRTDFQNVHSIGRLRDIMRKMGITHELERQGAEGVSIIRIAGHELTLVEQAS